MAHPSVTAFVEQASGSDSLKQRLQSADLSELLAIAREHDLHMGEADALYAHAKHGIKALRRCKVWKCRGRDQPEGRTGQSTQVEGRRKYAASEP